MPAYPPPLILPFDGRSPSLDPTVFVAPGVTIVGDVRIGAQSSLWFGAVVRGDENPVLIGARTNIQDLSMCHETGGIGPLVVGDEVTVGHRVTLHGCAIGNRCLIGMGAIVLDGATVGDECVIAAGAVVREGTVIPPRSLVVGVPAEVKRAVSRAELDRIDHAFRHYLQRAREYQALLAER
jgi:carbonic anhydrase/acetyltransferase-like protein (isoleucine patch superfamily)